MRADTVQNTEQMTAAVSKFDFYCCDKTLSKSNLRKKKLIWLTGYNPFMEERRTQHQKLKQRTQKGCLWACFLWVVKILFLHSSDLLA